MILRTLAFCPVVLLFCRFHTSAYICKVRIPASCRVHDRVLLHAPYSVLRNPYSIKISPIESCATRFTKRCTAYAYESQVQSSAYNILFVFVRNLGRGVRSNRGILVLLDGHRVQKQRLPRPRKSRHERVTLNLLSLRHTTPCGIYRSVTSNITPHHVCLFSGSSWCNANASSFLFAWCLVARLSTSIAVRSHGKGSQCITFNSGCSDRTGRKT